MNTFENKLPEPLNESSANPKNTVDHKLKKGKGESLSSSESPDKNEALDEKEELNTEETSDEEDGWTWSNGKRFPDSGDSDWFYMEDDEIEYYEKLKAESKR